MLFHTNSHLKVLGEKREIAIAASLYSFMIAETSKIFNASKKHDVHYVLSKLCCVSGTASVTSTTYQYLLSILK